MRACIVIINILFCFIHSYSQQIKSFTPASGPIGTVVTINGLNFGSSAANAFVFFGAVKADIISINPTTIKVVVPIGSTFEPITVVVNNKIAYSAKPFNVTFLSDSTITTNSFIEKKRITAEHSPFNVAIGDIDGDKKPDLAVINNASGILSLHRNISIDSNISFEPLKTFNDFLTPQVLAFGDFDCDGKLDIAATSYSDNKLVIYKNTSTVGVFSLAQPLKFSTSDYVREIAIRDLDLDGRTDIVLANMSGTISIFRNITNGSGISFDTKVDLTAGSYPRGLAIGDLDGDEKPEVIVSNKNSPTISIYKNNSSSGNLSLLSKIDISVGFFPEKLGIADFDGDGKQDIAIAMQGSNNLCVLRNTNTTNVISLANPITFPASSDPYNLAINDMNGDGKPDVVLNNFGERSMSVFLNKSNPAFISFSPRTNYTTLAYGSRGLALGDLDNDGRPEIIIANSGYSGCCGDTTVSIFQNKIGKSNIIAPPITLSASKIRVYPNPANDKIIIDTLLLSDNWQRMDLFSSDGKFIRAYDLRNKEIVTLQVDFLASSTYFLILYNNKGDRLTKKFVKRLE